MYEASLRSDASVVLESQDRLSRPHLRLKSDPFTPKIDRLGDSTLPGGHHDPVPRSGGVYGRLDGVAIRGHIMDLRAEPLP